MPIPSIVLEISSKKVLVNIKEKIIKIIKEDFIFSFITETHKNGSRVRN